jgi:hypothetical protein
MAELSIVTKNFNLCQYDLGIDKRSVPPSRFVIIGGAIHVDASFFGNVISHFIQILYPTYIHFYCAVFTASIVNNIYIQLLYNP